MENWFLTRQITPKDFVSFSITYRCGHHSAARPNVSCSARTDYWAVMASASHWSVLQLSQSWSSSYQIVVSALSSGHITSGSFQGKLSRDLSSFSTTHANLYLDISRITISWNLALSNLILKHPVKLFATGKPGINVKLNFLQIKK